MQCFLLNSPCKIGAPTYAQLILHLLTLPNLSALELGLPVPKRRLANVPDGYILHAWVRSGRVEAHGASSLPLSEQFDKWFKGIMYRAGRYYIKMLN